MSGQWYYTKNGQKFGPITDADLKQMASSGALQPNDSIWKEGMSDWKLASNFKDLFALGTNTQKTTNQNITGSKLSDASSGSFDQLGSQPAVFVHSDYFGGRTSIGNVRALHVLGRWEGMIQSAVLGWFYLISVLYGMASSWEFIPFKNTEYTSIKIKQILRVGKLFSLFITWILIQIGVFAFSFSFLYVLCTILKQEYYSIVSLVSVLLFLLGTVANNLNSCFAVSALNTDYLFRTNMVLSYGYPRKYVLLSGISDAPIEQQMDGVLTLCQAISSKAQFSPWEQFTAHSSGQSGMISRVVSRLPGLGG